ncbi:MAG TPA: ribonuclease D [Alphaproteobacteria bacterium]|nr:ribonuclease D [Alphaproteobacteria bacterium]
MTLIADSASLAAFCHRLASSPYVTVDTEFMRDKTYYPQLCLVQLAGDEEAAAVDTLAPGMDLAPLTDLLGRTDTLKVFHAGRQDIEIFYLLSGRVPAPIFDTQVAAMVCGFGDSVGYDTLVAKLTGAHIDKSSRFTDWSARPLTERQIRYAIEDVTHLRQVYEKLNRRLERSGRAGWLAEEMALLSDPQTYQLAPENAWLRLKTRSGNPRFLAVLRELAAWRELEAQKRNIPRNRMLRDEALIEIAAHHPANAAELARTRGLSRGFAEGRMGEAVLAAVRRGLAIPEEDCPQPPPRVETPRDLGAAIELLKVLLKVQCDAHHVAPKLVASAADLELIAADDDAPVAALKGWRREIFGEAALALKHGRLALALDGARLKLIERQAATTH